jgi:hypothetical protein
MVLGYFIGLASEGAVAVTELASRLGNSPNQLPNMGKTFSSAGLYA